MYAWMILDKQDTDVRTARGFPEGIHYHCHERKQRESGPTCRWSPRWWGAARNSLTCELTKSTSWQDAKVVPKAFQRNFWKPKEKQQNVKSWKARLIKSRKSENSHSKKKDIELTQDCLLIRHFHVLSLLQCSLPTGSVLPVSSRLPLCRVPCHHNNTFYYLLGFLIFLSSLCSEFQFLVAEVFTDYLCTNKC